MQTKNYSRTVKIAAITIIVFEWIILASGLGYLLYTKYGVRALGVSDAKINRENVVFVPTDALKHFYEWKLNQTIVHERAWLPHAITAVTNNDGLIGETNYTIEKPRDVYRIIAMEDSFCRNV